MGYANRLAGKVAIVTGIGSGIGKGCAFMFARAGAKVVSCDINPETAEAALGEARKEGLAIDSLHPCDLTAPEDVRKLVDFTVTKHGGVDILLNAAAFGAFAWIEDMDYETEWRKTLDGEISVVFLLCKTAWPHLKKRGKASIVNFASANAHVAFGPSAALAHCAGKGAVHAMTRQLAMEGAPHGIRANTISPGLIVTSATQGPLQNAPGFREAVYEKAMIKRLGQPEDIGWCAIYLASDESSFVTGSDYKVDGGATAW